MNSSFTSTVSSLGWSSFVKPEAASHNFFLKIGCTKHKKRHKETPKKLRPKISVPSSFPLPHPPSKYDKHIIILLPSYKDVIQYSQFPPEKYDLTQFLCRPPI